MAFRKSKLSFQNNLLFSQNFLLLNFDICVYEKRRTANIFRKFSSTIITFCYSLFFLYNFSTAKIYPLVANSSGLVSKKHSYNLAVPLLWLIFISFISDESRRFIGEINCACSWAHNVDSEDSWCEKERILADNTYERYFCRANLFNRRLDPETTSSWNIDKFVAIRPRSIRRHYFRNQTD